MDLRGIHILSVFGVLILGLVGEMLGAGGGLLAWWFIHTFTVACWRR